MWNSLSRRFNTLARRFARDRSGNVACMFALSFVPMLAFAGTAIDYGRAIQARDNLRQTTDAVTLAIARARRTERMATSTPSPRPCWRRSARAPARRWRARPW